MTASIRHLVGAAIVLAILLLGWQWHASRVAHAERAVHQHYAGVLAGISDKTAQAAQQIRAAEQAWQSKIEKEARDGQERIEVAQRDAADARAAADGLQLALDRYRAAARTTPRAIAAGAGQGESGGDPLDLLVGVLTRHSDELVSVGQFADAAHAAAVTCERIYDGIAQGQGYALTGRL